MALTGASLVGVSLALAGPASADSPSISCTTAQNGRTMNFSCDVNSTATYYLRVDCKGAIPWIGDFTKVWTGTLDGPQHYTYSITCPYTYGPSNAGWGLGLGA
ncbi:hypothetical protein F7Q99_29435 [Streptomyces kaniharaensis]|uniref:Uncharacterized protein n=1 Tax=Streptomyces kaniharaensis TaxID=212423 RepID=A0A6N7KX33_9ACTN|nr:hypothetical protein [Streptomyces kaniharaensis]MQS16236.1 hypothetical protein [Streptomyces kaniharaensis]